MEAPRSGQIAGPEQSFVAWTMPVLVSANGQKEIAIQGRTSHQLLDWLRRNSPGLVGAGSATTFAGHDAVEFDVHLNRGDACDTRLRAGCPFQAQEPDRWISHGLVVPVGQRLIAFVYRAPTAQGLDVARAELGRIRFQ
jgi:hypothetical protein